jgi:MoCo/4Fe-4S cofactor protein with predicted Tat translocation signal
MTQVSEQHLQRTSVADESARSSCCADTNAAGLTVTPSHRASSHHPSGKQYWRSVEDFADAPEFREFMHREFPAGASDMLDSSDRRQFLKIMGASMALAGMGLAGCRRWPEEKIAPYAYRPPGHNPGSAEQFATCLELAGVASALLVTSYDYRPIKIEGNPEHPISQGATDVIAQASILNLYDPDRSRTVMKGAETSDWNGFAAFIKDHMTGLRNARGNGLAILSESSSSPSLAAMKQRLLAAFPNARWHEYEPINNDNIVKGSMLAFGAPYRAHYAFDKAKVIVSLDADFLHCDGGAVKWTRDFARSRRAEDRATMSRLYVFESTPSITGANADHRVSLRSADVAPIAAKLAQALVPGAEPLQTLASSAVASSLDQETFDKTLEHLINDLRGAKGASVIVAGARQPVEVHYIVHLLNELLGNVGRTISYAPEPDAVPHLESIQALARNIAANGVQTLVIIGGNPAYNAPADLKFADLLKQVQTTIHLSDYVDETSRQCAWHVNRAHYLEAWGDGRSHDGTLCLAQPLIEPLFNGRSAIELLAAMTGDELTGGYDIVRRTVRELGSGADFDAFWRKGIHDGFIANSAAAAATVRVQSQNLAQHAQAMQAQWNAGKGGELEIVFIPDSSVYDGRFANNGWLQELPDPMTKLTWDNALLLSPAAAASRGLKSGDMVNLQVGGGSLNVPVLVLPGQFAGSAAIALGYGRGFEGRVCNGAGFNAYVLRTSGTMGFAGGASISNTGETYVLASTQDHHAPDTVGGKGTQERLPTLFREATLAEYQTEPDFAKERAHVVHRLSLWEERHPFHLEGQSAAYAWAMSIDLNACTGCSACVIACQAENNIPIVGKDQVKRQREMHWIRIDRYFKGMNYEAPESFTLAPVPCMHCENAPCEQVCPVAATTHDDQGLNVMVYNRCIGTRYCSNNCPYKVRRFNYFDYHARGPLRQQPGMLLQVEPEYYAKSQSQSDPLRQLQFNPEVTVRMRGIMEKCTFCVQRITTARIKAKNAWVKAKNLDPNAALDQRVPIEDGAITPACAQACPAQAIVFGDLHDPNSRVAKLHKHERTYEMLEELNTKPRTRYMARIRNPAFTMHSHNGDMHTHG